jgi:hypothetical protein
MNAAEVPNPKGNSYKYIPVHYRSNTATDKWKEKEHTLIYQSRRSVPTLLHHAQRFG